MTSTEQVGDKRRGARYTGEAIDSSGDLDWGIIENYGTDSELGGVIF